MSVSSIINCLFMLNNSANLQNKFISIVQSGGSTGFALELKLKLGIRAGYRVAVEVGLRLGQKLGLRLGQSLKVGIELGS